MTRIATTHICPHVLPRSRPEAGKITRRLNRPVRRRRQFQEQRQPPLRNGRVRLQPEKLLHANGKRRLAGVIADGVPLARRRFEMGRRQPAEISGDLMWHQGQNPFGKTAGPDVLKAPDAMLKRDEPFVQPRKQRLVADIRPGLSDAGIQKSDPIAQLRGLFRKRKYADAEIPNAVGERLRCLLTVGTGQGRFVQNDGAQTHYPTRPRLSARLVEQQLILLNDKMWHTLFYIGPVDAGRRKDARLRGPTRNVSDNKHSARRQPLRFSQFSPRPFAMTYRPRAPR